MEDVKVKIGLFSEPRRARKEARLVLKGHLKGRDHPLKGGSNT